MATIKTGAGGWQSNGIYSTAETARFGMHWIQLSEFPNQRKWSAGRDLC